jgi:hypothetical protein
MVRIDFRRLGAGFAADSLLFPQELISTNLQIYNVISWACEQYNHKFLTNLDHELVYLATEQDLELTNDQYSTTLRDETYYLKMVRIPCFYDLLPHSDLVQRDEKIGIEIFLHQKSLSWIEQLRPDPENERFAPNQMSRQVRSGHYVLVPPT